MLTRSLTGLRVQAFLLSLFFLFAIAPLSWLISDYQDVLLEGQIEAQKQLGATLARFLAPRLDKLAPPSNGSAPYYVHRPQNLIEIDGNLSDWHPILQFATKVGQNDLLFVSEPYHESSLNYSMLMVADPSDLFIMLSVIDDNVVYREARSASVHRNDHIQIAMINPDGNLDRFTIAPMQPGPVSAFAIRSINEGSRAIREDTRIEANFRATEIGYNMEVRVPREMFVDEFSLTVTDVDDTEERKARVTLGIASSSFAEDIGKLFLPRYDIDELLEAEDIRGSYVTVVDTRQRLLGSKAFPHADGNVVESSLSKQKAGRIAFDGLARAFLGESNLTRRQKNNLIRTEPVMNDGETVGAVIIEQSTVGVDAKIDSLVNNAVVAFIAIYLLGASLLVIFSSLIASRVSNLSNALENEATRGRSREQLKKVPQRDQISQLQNRIVQLTNHLNQYNQYLEAMSRRLAHELRTPVTVVQSSLDNLDSVSGVADGEGEIYVQRAREGIARLASILSNMTEATRLEESLDPAETEYFSLDKVISGCVSGYRIAYPEHTFELSIEDEFEALSGLPDLIAQMLDKLVSNAVQFSPDAKPIRVRMTKETKGGYPYAVVRVINEGPTLPDDSSHLLFDSMYSVRSGDDSSSHLGLGLYIARLITDFHGGTIEAENRPDVSGVIVTVSLPLMRITGRG